MRPRTDLWEPWAGTRPGPPGHLRRGRFDVKLPQLFGKPVGTLPLGIRRQSLGVDYSGCRLSGKARGERRGPVKHTMAIGSRLNGLGQWGGGGRLPALPVRGPLP